MITSLRAVNYKSLRSFTLELGPFNVLVGANGSGKSNVLDALAFLRDALTSSTGISRVIDAHGGPAAVFHRSDGPQASAAIGLTAEGTADPPRGNLELVLTPFGALPISTGSESAAVPTASTGAPADAAPRSDFELGFRGGQPARVLRETFQLLAPQQHPRRIFERDDRQLRLQASDLPATGTVPEELADYVLFRWSLLSSAFTRPLVEWQFLDIQPKAIAGGSPGAADQLSPDAGNLASFLRTVSPETREEIRAAVSRDVPGFRDFVIEEAGGRFFLAIEEEGAGRLPTASISAGTLRLLALYAAVYAERPPPLIAIEEPENGLHPTLLEGLAERLRSLGARSQVIVTTHSPILVDWCRPDEVVLLAKREGETRAVRASNRAQVEEFLKSFTLGDLWARGYLEEAA